MPSREGITTSTHFLRCEANFPRGVIHVLCMTLLVMPRCEWDVPVYWLSYLYWIKSAWLTGNWRVTTQPISVSDSIKQLVNTQNKNVTSAHLIKFVSLRNAEFSSCHQSPQKMNSTQAHRLRTQLGLATVLQALCKTGLDWVVFYVPANTV